jgi:Protein of unknown function, DUF
VPGDLQSCHTALVDGYVVEGHVPADLIVRLLRERPPVVGLAVPGMPVGSPGMDVPGGRTERYRVLSFDRTGAARTFATREPAGRITDPGQFRGMPDRAREQVFRVRPPGPAASWLSSCLTALAQRMPPAAILPPGVGQVQVPRP